MDSFTAGHGLWQYEWVLVFAWDILQSFYRDSEGDFLNLEDVLVLTTPLKWDRYSYT